MAPANVNEQKPGDLNDGRAARMLKRLSDRSKAPRRWWFPEKGQLHYDLQDIERLHLECSETIRRTSLLLLGFSFFALITLAAPDESLLGLGQTIRLPIANTDVSFLAFLYLTPIILIGISLYLHIFLGQWVRYSSTGLKTEKKLLTIFDIDNPVAVLVSGLLLYWLTPLVLLSLTWKALPRPDEGPIFVIVTCVVTGTLIFLKIRRCPEGYRRWNVLRWPILGLLLVGSTMLLLDYTRALMRGDTRPAYLFGVPVTRSPYLFKANLQNADLRRFQLANAYMAEAQLSGANLSGANLSGAILQLANLSGAKLVDAIMVDADLQDANLNGAILRFADLTGANLSRVNLKDANTEGGANLSRVNLQLGNMSGANLNHVDLNRADLRLANLSGTKLNQANLSGANLLGADLSGAQLILANLRDADLSGANLSGINLRAANLGGADLELANLRDADLTSANLTGTKVAVSALCLAKKLKDVKLLPPMMAEINEKCPTRMG